MSGPSLEPLVVADDLRVDVDDVPACDGITFRTHGDRILVLGAPRALYEALVGLRPVSRGALRLQGREASEAVRDGHVAGAALDPPLPPKWTAHEYVTWSSRLAGHTARDARGLARDAITRVQLGALATAPLGSLVTHARRAVVVAAALATDAPVLVIDDPLAALPEEVARTWAGIFVQALEGRSWIVLAARDALTSPIAMNAAEALVVSATLTSAQGAPAEVAAADRRFVARIHGSLDSLGTRLAARGARMEIQGAQVVLELGDSVTTAELLGMCAEANVIVVEMVPVARALA